MTRAEHLAWAKSRALEELEHGGEAAAISSMTSDLLKHDETILYVEHGLLRRSLDAALAGPEAVRAWIEGIE